MKIFTLKETALKLLTPDIVSLISQIEEKKGISFNIPKKKKINRLHDMARRRSVTSSNEIEGIKVTKNREEELFLHNSSAKTKEDYALLGYNKALTYIMDNYQNISFDEKLIKDLHYLMFENLGTGFGGKYKVMQNYITSFDKDGNFRKTVFIPSKPEEVIDQIGNLIWQFNDAANDYSVNKLILIFLFILDFLCIHPFPDGNGRVSRLLTTFLLLKFGYSMDEYYSLSYLILEHQEEYYNSIELSDQGWKINKNDPTPFVRFHLLRLIEGYDRIIYIFNISSLKGNCDFKVLKVINDYRLPTSKTYLEEILFEYSRSAIEKSLSNLLKQKKIKFYSSGHVAKYVANK